MDAIAELDAYRNLERAYDASDPEAVNKARIEEGRKLQEERRAIFELMQIPHGRRLMYGSVRCVVEGNPMVPGDAHSTFYNLGNEHRARQLFLELVKIAPRQFVTMMKENAGVEYAIKPEKVNSDDGEE